MEDLLKSLIYIQQNLTVPKDQFNSFGKFHYRSLESILAALKPLLAEQHCGIRFADEVVEHGGRTFVKTTLTFFNEKGVSLSTTAEAEHSQQKTGMDSAQITGAASSYCRKYCLGALFMIDDAKDADTDSYHQQTQQRKTVQRRTTPRAAAAPASDPRYAAIEKALKECTDIDQLIDLYEQHRNEVEANLEIKNLFSERKRALRVITF
jgi:hypothetical protein